jgi:hypothetical protein
MANKQSTGKAALASRASALIEGTKKHYPKGSQSILVGGASTTVNDAVNELETLVTNRSAVVSAQATAKSKVSTEKTALPALVAFLNAFTKFVRFTFENDPEALADFGLAPYKERTPMTAEDKAVAVAKRDATRKARGTMSPKEKAQIHGNVTAQLVVTPGAAAESEPASGASAPAAASSSGTAQK